jgi:hypothetical protein
MVKTDAQEALSIYKAFVKQNDKVVDYLNTARRLKNVLDVPVPNLKHVSTPDPRKCLAQIDES